ncbi:variable surface protein [Plasmodium gonderi]|uniref:Variable surface protein n=1 Tax=Plasmodium gonderi TaxID=77519 RepID=A0A1Y1JP64_PLAGO|nr:variable surface protein [Plasmodium gonderi]GAW84259.1 variable surface protein [Plasmodium gonderi]
MFFIENYNSICLFPIFREIIDAHKGDEGSYVTKKGCNYNLLTPYLLLKENNACNEIMLYLADIQSINDSYLKEVSCKYLYFLVSPYIKDRDNDINHIKNIYSAFLKGYKYSLGNHPDHICIKYKDTITVDDLTILNAIHDVRTYFKEIKDVNREKSYNDDYFIQTVNIIKNHYKEPIKTVVQKIYKEKLIPCEKRNISFPILITVLVMVLICVFLFTLSYTTLGSYIQNNIRILKNKRNNSNNEWNIMPPSEVSRNTYSDDEFNVFYNFN